MKTVAIIGRGFCGTMAAVNLARLAKAPVRIVVINDGNPTGRGVAYASPYLFAIGPMLKGSLWETTAVPELRLQALRVSERLGWFAEMWVDVVEYAI